MGLYGTVLMQQFRVDSVKVFHLEEAVVDSRLFWSWLFTPVRPKPHLKVVHEQPVNVSKQGPELKPFVCPAESCLMRYHSKGWIT